MKINCILFNLFFIFFALQTSAQSFFALSTGVSTDLNNKKPFYSIPVTLRWEPFRRSAFFIEATQGIGFNRLSDADAYTTKPQLPQHVLLTESINVNAFSVGIGGAIVLYTNKRNNRFTLNLSTGVIDEYYKVDYRNYDNKNYEVLNPDVSKDLSGLYVCSAVVYYFHKSKQDMFIQIQVQSPSTAGNPDRYSLSYNKTAALELTYGYRFFYNKK